MRRANFIALTMGSAALIVAGAVSAAPPTPFDQWQATVVDGQTELQGLDGTPLANPANCPEGFTCGAAIFGDGFVQRPITETATGIQYFHTIITDKAAAGTPATLGFYDESFVRSSGGGSSATGQNGIAGKQRVTDFDTAAGTELITNNILNVGWAASEGEPVLDLQQTVSETSGAFSTSFHLIDEAPAAGGTPGPQTGGLFRTIDIDQSVELVAGGDSQVFALRQLDATAAGSATLPNGGATVEWAAGDTIQAIWLGQNMPTTGGQVFGFQGYSNVTDNVTQSFFTLAPPVDPQEWPTAVFGEAPGFQP